MAKKPKALYRVKPCIKGEYRAIVYWDVGGRPRRRYFETERKARAWADLQTIAAQNSGRGVMEMTDELRVEALQALAIVEPFGRSILDAARFAADHWQTAHQSKTVKGAVAELVAARRRDKRSARYLADLKGRLAQFAASFGDAKISTVSASDIRQWLNSLPTGPVSRNNTRRVLSVLWSFAIENEWCNENPVERVGSANEGAKTIGILSPQEAAKLLLAAPPRSRPLFAVGLFCGLRRSELCRVTPESVRLAAGLVEVSVRKTGVSRRFVKIRRNLRAWLLGCGPVQALTEQQFRDDLDIAVKGAGIAEWPHNAMRHSFCSYALAHERDIKDLSLEMGHTNPATLFAHYRELVTPADAADYWRLTPARASGPVGRSI